MMDSGLMQLIAGLAVLFLVIEAHWYGLTLRAIAWVHVKVKPESGRCLYIGWNQMRRALQDERLPAEAYMPLHQCRGGRGTRTEEADICLCKWSREAVHEPSQEVLDGEDPENVNIVQPEATIDSRPCWTSTFRKFFNVRPQHRKKPQTDDPLLSVRTRYLAVDRKVLLAYILCTLPQDYEPRPNVDQTQAYRHFEEAGLKIEVLPTKEQLERHHSLIVHLTRTSQSLPMSTGFSVNNHSLTISELECLLDGYPPFYRETIRYGGVPLRRGIMTTREAMASSRGGWVLALGFADRTLKPTPVYIDRRQGGNLVFWESLKRLRDTIDTNFLKLFTADNMEVEATWIRTTIKLLDHLIKGTTSGAPDHSILYQKVQPLSKEDCEKAINLFNEKHCRNMGPTDLRELGAFLKQATQDGFRHYVLLNILRAAADGGKICVDYIRHGGRNLNIMVPESIQTADILYLQSC